MESFWKKSKCKNLLNHFVWLVKATYHGIAFDVSILALESEMRAESRRIVWNRLKIAISKMSLLELRWKRKIPSGKYRGRRSEALTAAEAKIIKNVVF